MTEDSDKYISYGLSFTIGDDGNEVEVCKLETLNGERLQIVSNGSSIRLDALILETLTWHHKQVFADLEHVTPEDRIRFRPDDQEGDEIAQTDRIPIVNEFADVYVRKIERDGVELLEIDAVKQGGRTLLDANDLTLLARQRVEVLSNLLEEPFGPIS